MEPPALVEVGRTVDAVLLALATTVVWGAMLVLAVVATKH